MPPRIPAAGLFVACYVAAVVGGGPEAAFRAITLWDPEIARAVFGAFGFDEGDRAAVLARLASPGETSGEAAGDAVAAAQDWAAEAWRRMWTGRLWLSIGETLALAAAVMALPDAAWRPARRWADLVVSAALAVGFTAAFAVYPAMLTASSAVLAAILWGDALSACGRRSRDEVY